MSEIPASHPSPRHWTSCDERRRFPTSASSAAAARRFVAGCIVDRDLARHAALLVSELATNAIVHAQTPFEVRVRVSGGKVRVEVTDDSPAALRVRAGSQERAHGRGLRVVDAIASTWGVEAAPPGKRVWFDLGAPRRASKSAPPSRRGTPVRRDVWPFGPPPSV